MTLEVANRYVIGGLPTIADVDVIGEPLEETPPIAIVTERADNPGLSITNNAEGIVAECRRRYGPAVIVVEHYGPDSYVGGRHLAETFDLVEFDDGYPPTWTHLGRTRAGALDVLARSLP